MPWSGPQTSPGTRSRAKQTPPCHTMWPRCRSVSQYLPVIKPQSTHGLNSNFSSPTALTTNDMKESNHAKLCHVLPQTMPGSVPRDLSPCVGARIFCDVTASCNDHIFPERAADRASCCVLNQQSSPPTLVSIAEHWVMISAILSLLNLKAARHRCVLSWIGLSSVLLS